MITGLTFQQMTKKLPEDSGLHISNFSLVCEIVGFSIAYCFILNNLKIGFVRCVVCITVLLILV